MLPMTSTHRLGWTALALLALVGCDTGVATPTLPPTSSKAANAPGENEVKAMPVAEGAVMPLTADQVAEIKKLPAEDQSLALAQKVCPVSHEPLGGDMGVPIKQVIGDKTFFVCCSSCKARVKEKPDQVLAELAKLNGK
jgi:hypothetical protein